MPSWSIHLKFPKCPNENMIDLNGFLEDYKSKLNNPMIIGYYCHLLTDNFYNEYIYYNKWIQDKDNEVVGIKKNDGSIIDILEDYKLTGIYKHKDLELYGKRIFNTEQLIIPSNIDNIIQSLPLLNNEFITKENVINRLKYLNNEFIEFNNINEEDINKEYELFNKEELDKLLNDCINYIIDELKKVGVMNE